MTQIILALPWFGNPRLQFVFQATNAARAILIG
jgi:hypothetical protein